MIIALLAIIGLSIASYFTAIAYHWVQPDASWIPTFCRMDEKTCASIVFADEARVFRLPNSVLGQLYYLTLLVGGGVGGRRGRPVLRPAGRQHRDRRPGPVPFLLASVRPPRSMQIVFHGTWPQHRSLRPSLVTALRPPPLRG